MQQNSMGVMIVRNGRWRVSKTQLIIAGSPILVSLVLLLHGIIGNKGVLTSKLGWIGGWRMICLWSHLITLWLDIFKPQDLITVHCCWRLEDWNGWEAVLLEGLFGLRTCGLGMRI